MSNKLIDPTAKRKTVTAPIRNGIVSLVKKYQKPAEGLFTGISDVDDKFGRLLTPSNVLIVAARPGVGKTVIGVQVAEYQAMQGRNVLIWSLEMSDEQLGERLIVKRTDITTKRLVNREITDKDWPLIQKAAGEVSALPLYVNDLSEASDQYIYVESLAVNKELVDETGQGLALIVVDYLQLASGEGGTRELEVSAVSRSLRKLAKDLKVPVMAMAQINREAEKRSNKRPCLADLRESGAIEQNAHTVMFLYRESIHCEDCINPTVKCGKNHESEAEVIIAKNRSGERGSVVIHFNGPRQFFANAAHRDHGDKPKIIAPGDSNGRTKGGYNEW